MPNHHLITLLAGFIPFCLSAQSPAISCPPISVQISDTTANSELYWNANHWWDQRISSHNLAEAVFSSPVEAVNHCDSGTVHFRYQLELDLDGDQLPETIVDSDSLPARNTIWFGNMNGTGTARTFDSRSVIADSLWGFALAILPSADSLFKAQMVWENNAGERVWPQLPYGNHRLTWLATDACGQTSTCATALQISDGAPPVLSSLNALSINLQPSGGACMAVVHAADFILYVEDNYVNANQLLTIALRRAGTGTGIPLNPDGTPVQQLTFSPSDLGYVPIELWAMDLDSNVHTCISSALVGDPMACAEPIQCTGYITTIEGEPIDDVNIQLEPVSNGFPILFGPPQWGPGGCYQIFNGFPAVPAARIRPLQDIDQLNGVSVWDLVLISRHILALQPITSPYYLIAADANLSKTVTTLDIVELRKLILGIYSELPFNTSWRFIDRSQVFQDPLNPFLEPIRDTILFTPTNNTGLDFYGIKVGDIDGSAVPNNLLGVDDRRLPAAYFDWQRLDANNWSLSPGEEATLLIAGPAGYEAGQLALVFSDLELLGVQTEAGLLPEQVHVGATFLHWVNERGIGAIRLRVRAKKALLLDQALVISENKIPAKVFLSNGQAHQPQLRAVKSNKNTAAAITLISLAPNPWQTHTAFEFDLNCDSPVQLQIMDALGRRVYTAQKDLTAGKNTWKVTVDLPAGSYYYQLQSGKNMVSGKMIKG